MSSSITKLGQVWQRIKGIINNPNTLRPLIEDAIEADTSFSALMGEDVEPRRKYIQDNAMNVVNLDV